MWDGKYDHLVAATEDIQASGRWVRNEGYEILEDPIEKASTDEREYRAIRLANGLLVFLIHDPGAEKAAAALDVAVGHMNDPDDMPGLAHFCEHLLFMGTELFPRENDYHEFISSHGGTTNAWTAPSDTNYHFKVGAQHLEPALARFSAFFHCPLFEPTCTDRELNAVDSENKKNMQDDGWRLFQLGKGLSTEGHPWRKFGTGSKESLLESARRSTKAFPAGSDNSDSNSGTELDGGAAGRFLRSTLIEWWKSQYCARRMKAAILGSSSVDELTRMAVQYFSPIPDRNLPPTPKIRPPPLGPEEMGTVLYAQSVKDIHTIDISCCIPPQDFEYESRPASFVAHLVGHEGSGSLHLFLKKKGWITGLNTSAQALGRGFDVVRAVMNVTPAGLEHWRELVIAYFQYVLMLKVSALSFYLFQEHQALSSIRFTHRDKSNSDAYVRAISSNLQRPFPVHRVLTAPLLLWRWEEGKVREVLDLVDIRKCRVIVCAKDLSKVVSEPSWLRERWYGTEYRIEPLDTGTISQSLGVQPSFGFFVPRPNQFIPEFLHMDRPSVQASQIALFPTIIRENEKMVVWFKKDDQFWTPKGSVIVRIKSPVAGESPVAVVMSQLLVNLVTDSLTEYSYEAELAGLLYSLSSTPVGFQLSVAGYDDKIPILLRTVMESIAAFKPDPARFSVMLHHLQLKLQNLRLESPFMITDHWLRLIIKTGEWSRDRLLGAISGITLTDLEEHFRRAISQSSLEVLIHGNFTDKRAESIITDIDEVLGSEALPRSNYPVERALVLPEGSNITLSVEALNDSEVNSALSFFCQVGQVADDKLRATFSLFGHLAQHSVFNQLRTKEQLGYMVSAAVWHAATHMGWRIRIQSERDPEYLESRVEHFLANLQDRLDTMDEEEFNRYKYSLIALKEERVRNLSDEMTKFWAAIQSGYCDFIRDPIDGQTLRQVHLNDVRALYMTYIRPASMQRQKVSIWCHAKGPATLQVCHEAIKELCSAIPGLEGVLTHTQVLELASGEFTLPRAVLYIRQILKQIPAMTPGFIEHIACTLIRCARRHAKGREYHISTSEASALRCTHITDAEVFRDSLPISNPPFRVMMPQDRAFHFQLHSRI